MNRFRIDIFRYAIPFTEPLTVRGLGVAVREGLVIAFAHRQDGTAAAWGEVAPLPGLHDESLAEAERALISAIPCLPAAIGASPGDRASILDDLELPPSIHAGLEMALLNREAASKGIGALLRCRGEAARTVPVNGLLFGSPEAVVDRAKKAVSEGFRAFKLKVRADRLDDAAASIRAIHAAFGGAIELRLDANQSMELEDAVRFGLSLPSGSVAYIEEPLQDPALIPEFHARTGMPSALDESLWQCPELLGLIPAASLGAVVLKPNRIGGIGKTLDIVDKAAARGLPAVYSSAFETGISMGLYAMMAACSSPHPAACGFDTASRLACDLPCTPFTAPGGAVDPEAAWKRSFSIRQELLQPIGSWTL